MTDAFFKLVTIITSLICLAIITYYYLLTYLLLQVDDDENIGRMERKKGMDLRKQ